MANMNTLFRKGYLLAGVVMAANMFVVNEMKAMDTKDNTQNNEKNNNENEMKATENDKKQDNNDQNNNNKDNSKLIDLKDPKGKEQDKNPGTQDFLGRFLSWENTFNLIGGSVFSFANNYFKLWNYDAGVYCEFGCLGWRSKRLLNGLLQFEGNFNAVRGISWSTLHIINLIITKDKKSGKSPLVFYLNFTIRILKGFVSAPMTLHFSNFSVSVSLDSIIWMVVDNIFLGKKDGEKEGQPGDGKDIKNEQLRVEGQQGVKEKKTEDNNQENQYVNNTDDNKGGNNFENKDDEKENKEIKEDNNNEQQGETENNPYQSYNSEKNDK